MEKGLYDTCPGRYGEVNPEGQRDTVVVMKGRWFTVGRKFAEVLVIVCFGIPVQRYAKKRFAAFQGRCIAKVDIDKFNL